MKNDTRWELSALWALFCFLALAALGAQRWTNFDTTSWDNAIFTQAVRSYAEFNWPIVNIKGPDYNILGDHFSPINALLAPLWWIWPSGLTLIVAQAALLAVSIYVVTTTALRHLGPWFGGAVALGYGISFGLWSAAFVEFHEVAWAAPLLALAGRAYLDGRWTAVFAWTLPLLLVKEDMGATVLMVGVVAFWCGQRMRGAWLAAAGIATMLLVLYVIIPAFSPGGAWEYTNRVDDNTGLLAQLTQNSGEKIETIVLTFAITGFLALGSRWSLLVLPTLAWRMLGNVEFYWGTVFHYSLILMPIVFIAMIEVIRRWRGHSRPVNAALAVAVIGSLVAGAYTSTRDYWSLGELFKSSLWVKSESAKTADTIMDTMPKGATVVSGINMLSHLAAERDAYWIGTAGDIQPDFIVINNQSDGVPQGQALTWAQDRWTGPWSIVVDENGWTVLKHTSDLESLNDSLAQRPSASAQAPPAATDAP